MKGSGPVFRKNSYNCLFFHCIRCCLPLSNDSLQLEKQGGRSGCRCDTAGYKIHKQIKHVEYFLHSWLHLLFDPIQCVSSSTWIHRTFCQISSNATLKQTIPWDLHRIKSLFVWLLLLSSIMSTCSSPSLWCRRGTAEHLCDWGWMYGQRYAATVLNLMMAKGYSHTVSKLKKKKRSLHLHGSTCSEIPLHYLYWLCRNTRNPPWLRLKLREVSALQICHILCSVTIFV